MDKFSSADFVELLNLRTRISNLKHNLRPDVVFKEKESTNDISRPKVSPNQAEIIKLQKLRIEFESKFGAAYIYLEDNSTPKNWYKCESDGLQYRAIDDNIYQYNGSVAVEDRIIKFDQERVKIISKEI